MTNIEKLNEKINKEIKENEIKKEIFSHFEYLNTNFHCFVRNADKKEICIKFDKNVTLELIRELYKTYNHNKMYYSRGATTSLSDRKYHTNAVEVENIKATVSSLKGDKINISIVFYSNFDGYNIQFEFTKEDIKSFSYDIKRAGKTIRSQIVSSELFYIDQVASCFFRKSGFQVIKWWSSYNINDCTFFIEKNKLNEFEIFDFIKKFLV